MQFADPRTDFAFTLIFGNEKAKDVLISFLNAVLGLEGVHAISEVAILNPYQAPMISTLKRSFLDVKCRANMTKEEWEEYDAAAVKMQDERGIAIAAEKKGWQQRNLEMARSMRQKGLDMNLIAELTGLSLQVIENLTKESVAE